MTNIVQRLIDEPMKQALFRYTVLSVIFADECRGEKRSRAVSKAAAMVHLTADKEPRSVGDRSIYRWLAAFEARGFDGLIPVRGERSKDSLALPRPLIEFFIDQKTADPDASIPELIRRAATKGMIPKGKGVDRTTVWRTLQRMGVDVSRRKNKRNLDRRRFSYPHRMQMALCDGKHFRAGRARLRRVALFFIDDCTRKALHVVVGTSESAELFLRGLYETILLYGLMDALFVDNGSGFIATDAIEVLRKLGVLFIHGTPGYPEGHGKIERFNRTAKEQVLRFFAGNPEIDPACEALELRLRHYIREQYNLHPHESLDKRAPDSRFLNDKKPLRFMESEDQLRQAFVLHARRRVSSDNVVSLNGLQYEMIRGHMGARVVLHRNLLDGSVGVVHKGRLVRLAPLDPHKNARERRAKNTSPEKTKDRAMLPKSSAQLSFEQAMPPVVDPDGNFIEPGNQMSKED
jgi:transposase InsO family protein